MLPAALRGEPGTFPTSAAGVAAAPLRCAPPLSPRGFPSSGSSAQAPTGGGSRRTPERAPLAELSAEARSKAKPGAAVPRRAQPHAATASLSPAPTPRSPAHTRGEDPSAHRHPLPSHCSRPPLARTESPVPFATRTLAHIYARTHPPRGHCFGEEGDAAPGEQFQRTATAKAAPARLEARRYLSRGDARLRPHGAQAGVAGRETPSGAARAAGRRCRAGRRGAAMGGAHQLQVQPRAQPGRGHPAPARQPSAWVRATSTTAGKSEAGKGKKRKDSLEQLMTALPLPPKQK